MKTRKQNIMWRSKHAKRYKWRLVVLLIPVVVIALMLIGVSLIKDKVRIAHHVSNSYRAGDVAVFVAMPVLRAVMK